MRLLFPAKKGLSNDDLRLNQLLQTIVLPWIALLLIFSLSAIFFFSANIGRWIFILIVFGLINISTLWLASRGYIRTAILIFLFEIWLLVTGLAWTAGGMQSSAVIAYFLLILATSILLGMRAGVFILIIVILSALSLALADVYGVLPENQVPYKPLSRWLGFSFIAGLITILAFISASHLRIALNQVTDELAARKTMEKERSKLMHDLGERVKELTCLHNAARVLQPGVPLDERTLQSLADSLPVAWQFTHICAGRITFGSLSAQSERWSENPVAKQRSHIVTSDGAKGTIEVIYTREAPISDEGPFLKEERVLLDSLAEMISSHLEHTKSQKEIQESEERFRTLFNAAQDTIFSLSVRGKIISVNSAFEQHLGWVGSEWLGRSFTDLVHPDQIQQTAALLQATAQGKGQESQHLRIQKKDATYTTQELLLTPQWKDNQAIGILCIARDITERTRLEEQLRRSQRLDSIGTLASGIAHDLNNVLTPILLAADYLHDFIRDGNASEMLNLLHTSAKRGRDIVKQVLTFAKGAESPSTPQQIRYILTEIESLIRETFPKNIELETDISQELSLVMADSTQLHQVFMNLCVNARDALPKGGKISLKASDVNVEEEIPNLKPGKYLLVQVTDNGTGISKDDQEKVFEPFFSTKETGKGTGLGLSTVYGIVRSHGGQVKLYSELGRGTNVSVYLPAHGEESSKEDLAPLKDIPKGSGERVFIIDDEPSVLRTTKEALESNGYRVTSAINGMEALQLFSTFPLASFSVVITDVDMPKMNGPDTIRAMKGLDASIKVILTSGMIGDLHSAEFEGLNIQYYLPKPFSVRQLLSVVQKVLADEPGLIED